MMTRDEAIRMLRAILEDDDTDPTVVDVVDAVLALFGDSGRKNAAEPEGPAALRDPKELQQLPVVFLGPDVIALVRAARQAAYVLHGDCDFERVYAALVAALKPFEGIGEGE